MVMIMKKRAAYFVIFCLLTAAEVLIGMYAHGFVRNYFGDFLVVILIFFFIRTFIPENYTWLSAGVFAFALGVEILQGIDIVGKLSIKNELLRIIIGTEFEYIDIVCYAAGCSATQAYDLIRRKMKNVPKEE